MSTIKIKNADAVDKFFKTTGAGTASDPFQNATKIEMSDSASLDAFARLRISDPHTLFDSKQLFDNLSLYWDDQEVSGGGTTSVHSVNKARTQLGVALNTAGKRIRQTFMRFNYQPGKSQLVIMTGVLGTGTSGIKQELGLFEDNNGLFFQCDGTVLAVVIRSKSSGSVVDSVVIQSNWNLDKMDGTGLSGITLDLTKTQIFFMDFEWLGVGRIRFGFMHNGVPIYVHEFLNSNVIADVYMSTPNLPLRYSIENDGTGAATTLDHICSTVISEGGQQENGILRYKSTEGVHVDANVIDTVYAVIGIRLKTTHLGAVVKQITASLLAETADDFEWIVILNPTVAGTFTYTGLTNSAIEAATGALANTITGGTQMMGGWASASSGITIQLQNAIHIGCDIANVVDELVLCVRPLSVNLDIQGGLTWRELV